MNSHLSFSHFSCCHYLCVLVVLALFHSCLSNENADQELCMDVERQALLRFKDGLVDETNRLASWVAEDRDCCKWSGIACDNSTGHVDWVHLPGYCVGDENTEKEYEEDLKYMLKGDISSSLLDLKQLKHLDLSCNNFGGIEIPKFIGSLENLRYLNLSYSVFGGTIPQQLGNLSQLHVLCLGAFGDSFFIAGYDYSASMKSMRWLSSLGKLQHLDMSGNDLRLAMDWLQVINTLPSLVQLHLSNCRLSNIYPHVQSLNLSSLSSLDLSINWFNNRFPQWIFSITSLVSLDISSCGFYGLPLDGSRSFHNMTSLKSLYLRHNYFKDASLLYKGLSSSNLNSLDISDCLISSSDLDSLHNLTSIRSLRLSSNILTKKIPKSLGNLCNLREIDISNNRFGKVSLSYLLESFFECKSSALESLCMSSSESMSSSSFGPFPLTESYIVGIIPHSIGNLSFLRILSLHKNKIVGPIPYSIQQLSSLEVLDLSSNQLNGSLPDKIGGLSSLRLLGLSDNLLTGNLPRSLGKLSNLISLRFSHNLLTGIVTQDHFSNLVNLIYLDGSSNNLILSHHVKNLIPTSSMEHLNLNSWVLEPKFLVWLQSQKELSNLDISMVKISSPIPESFIASFPKLRYLNISHNQIQGTLPLFPATLVAVDASSNEFSGSLNELLCSSGVKETFHLNLGNNHLSGVIPECLEKWPKLNYLNLENNSLSGEIPRTLSSTTRLQILIIRGNKISGRLPTSLMNLGILRILQLEENEIDGSIPAWIGAKLTSLALLNLRSNRFYGNIPHELCYLQNIRVLVLANNNLSGNIPTCFNNMSVLSGVRTNLYGGYQLSPPAGGGSIITSDPLVTNGRKDTYSTNLGLVKLLDLSSNNLIGHIPSELMSLKMLNSLNLSRNELIGTIPENIGDMKELISLDLSINKLTGELPMSLSKLSFLSSFNVSYNKLTGKIPISTQIQSLNESSFFGNKLCGAPLTETNGCVRVDQVPHVAIRNKKANAREDWGLIISILVGFFTGFWMFVGSLITSRSWSITYFRSLSKLINI